jgi:regulator of sirC expression with transglutaminase-like and TPR domain
MTGAIERLLDLLESEEPPLDRLMAVLASIDDAPPSEASVVERFDFLASGFSSCSDPDEILAEVFGSLGFRGNTDAYYDIRNSLIHHVLQRRVGIPLTLAVVAVELARRCGITLTAIGMPGHVLLGTQSDDRWFDPFAGGRSLTRAGCEELFHSIRPDLPFHDRYLTAMPAATIVGRTLENMRAASLHHGDRSRLAAVLRLRAALPGAPVEFRVEYAMTLAAIGRYDAAAAERDVLTTLHPERADQHRLEARRLRSHRN